MGNAGVTGQHQGAQLSQLLEFELGHGPTFGLRHLSG